MPKAQKMLNFTYVFIVFLALFYIGCSMAFCEISTTLIVCPLSIVMVGITILWQTAKEIRSDLIDIKYSNKNVECLLASLSLMLAKKTLESIGDVEKSILKDTRKH